jgi:hypothetical protein
MRIHELLFLKEDTNANNPGLINPAVRDIQTKSSKDIGGPRTIQPRVRTHSNDAFDDTKDSDRVRVGSGVFADVYKRSSRPGVVYKYGQFSPPADYPQKDAYVSYIMALLKNDQMASNPHFPRVFDIRFWRDSQGKLATYRIEMEELHPLTSLSPQLLSSMGHRLFKDWDDVELGLDFNDYAGTQYRLATALAYRVQLLFNGEGTELLQDRYLFDAVRMIKTRVLPGARNLDIHYGNIMARTTPVGAQLVITDPVV